MKGFMESYGLKMWDDGDYKQAKSLLDEFRKDDAADAAAEADKANGK